MKRLTASLYEMFKFITEKLPESRAYIPGKLLGKLAYLLSGARGDNSRVNIQDAFSLDKEEADNILKKVYTHLGMTFSEFILEEKMTADDIERIVNFDKLNYLDNSLKREKGTIIYSGHFGNWELMAAALALKGYKVNAIARTQNNSIIDEKINRVRENKNISIIPKGISVRKAYKALKKGEVVLILGDQDARGRGWKMKFFDKPASTYTGAVQLAKRTGAAIVPAFLIREGWLEHRLLFYPPVFIDKKTEEKVQKAILQDLIDLTEDIIKKHPEQWMWLHRRWKTYQ